MAKAALLKPWDEADPATPLEAVQAERLERWSDCRLVRGSERSAIVAPILAVLATDPPAVEVTSARAEIAPALWLLDRAEDAIGLTQTGALNRALVRALVEEYPEWWDDAFGPPSREDEVAPLHVLHGLLRELRLVRRRGRRIVITNRGREAVEDPAKLLVALAEGLLRGKGFLAACAELVGALILSGEIAPDVQGLAERMHPAITERGWRSEGRPVSRRQLEWMVADVLRAAEAIGLLARAPDERRGSRGSLVLTEVGRIGWIAGLRARALAPFSGR